MKYIILAILGVFIVCLCLKNKKNTKKENFTDDKKVINPTQNYTIEKPKYVPKKCKQHTRIYGRPNKCFSCEKDILNRAGSKYIHYAFPTKCFSCEKESKRPYFEGPTKCFSCK